jgi:hypothetical protein
MSKKFYYLLPVLTLLMTGCAHVEVTKISDQKPYEDGIRFYRPWPYLLVSAGPTEKEPKATPPAKPVQEALTFKIVMLPRMSDEYVIKVHSGIGGSVEAKFTLENGWMLTQFGETRDSKTPEMINALTGTLKEGAAIATAAMIKGIKEGEKPLGPGLYRLNFDEKTGFVVSIEPVVLINPSAPK